MKTTDSRKGYRGRAWRFLLVTATLTVLAAQVQAQTEPEAPREPEKLYNGWQFALFGGLNLAYMNGEYYGGCPCEFLGDETSANGFYGVSLNVPLFADASIYLRLGRNRTSTSWSTGRNDSLWSTPGVGVALSDMTIDYDLLHFDFLLRLFGHIDGERVYLGPSFGFVREKHVRITDTEFESGAVRVIEDGPLDIEHDLRVSFVIGAEYAFVPFRNLYVIPAFEVDYAFDKLVRERAGTPNFRLRPTFYKFYLTLAYQMF